MGLSPDVDNFCAALPVQDKRGSHTKRSRPDVFSAVNVEPCWVHVGFFKVMFGFLGVMSFSGVNMFLPGFSYKNR